MKKLIINADDFGYTPGVSAGIIEAHKRGIVTSTTALSVSPYFLEGMALAHLYAPTLTIGLHLTLTLRHAKPILPADEVPSLVDEKGEFLNPNEIVVKASMDEVEKEWEAQILRFLSSGKKPNHLDSHHNIHGGSEELLQVALKLAKKYNLALRNCERKPEQVGMIKLYGNTKTPDQMKAKFYGDLATLSTFESILDEIVASDKVVFEMNCHPAFIDYQLEDWSSYCSNRTKELRLLTSKEMREAITSRGILLTNYEIF
jgi:predicted glycoside hydrolase/deacetylase ChbG (UPF0249 family)